MIYCRACFLVYGSYSAFTGYSTDGKTMQSPWCPGLISVLPRSRAASRTMCCACKELRIFVTRKHSALVEVKAANDAKKKLKLGISIASGNEAALLTTGPLTTPATVTSSLTQVVPAITECATVAADLAASGVAAVTLEAAALVAEPPLADEIGRQDAGGNRKAARQITSRKSECGYITLRSVIHDRTARVSSPGCVGTQEKQEIMAGFAKVTGERFTGGMNNTEMYVGGRLCLAPIIAQVADDHKQYDRVLIVDVRFVLHTNLFIIFRPCGCVFLYCFAQLQQWQR